VRKNVKDSDDKGGADAGDAADFADDVRDLSNFMYGFRHG
jgi:hypothetical protein